MGGIIATVEKVMNKRLLIDIGSSTINA